MTEALQPVPDCPGPLADIRAPRFAVPAGTCDCHLHVFGPHDRFPLAESRSYTPPEASVESYKRVMRALNIQRCVLVQPSVYGTDNRATLEASRQLGAPDSCRVVAVVNDEITEQELETLDRAGVRGVRLNLIAGGGPDLDRLETIAARVGELGWHVQVYAQSKVLHEAAFRLGKLATDLVIDHFGSLSPSDASLDEVRALLGLLEGGRVWLKLSGGYISSNADAGWGDMAALAQRFAAARPDRLLWGTNWPHPVRYRPMPNDGALLDALRAWIEDDDVLHHVLVDNPQRLYGFASIDHGRECPLLP